MDSCCAPQWTDFTSSPQLPSDSYFEMEHEVHEAQIEIPETNFPVVKQKATAAVPNLQKPRVIITSPEGTAASALNETVCFNTIAEDYVEGAEESPEEFPVIQTSPKEVQTVVQNKRLSHKLRRRSSHGSRMNRTSPGKPLAPRVLTCQRIRHTHSKPRRRSGQFVSMAEAVYKFHRETPDRFRTITHKDLKPKAVTKTKQAALKLTCPVSPVLRSKLRSRTGNILTQEQRELQEIEKMKKLKIKPNPVKQNILKAPPALKKVETKPNTVIQEFRLTQSSTFPAPSSHSTTSSIHCMKATRALPFSFEVRDKELQKKKEQRIKSLQEQEAIKNKSTFHARPVPNFTKTASAQKEVPVKKPIVVPCPFSFDERDKSLAKKKEQRLKHILEERNKSQPFHANPVPAFKPVTSSRILSKSMEQSRKLPKAKEDQENKQPNIVSQEHHVTKHTVKELTANKSSFKLPEIFRTKEKLAELNMDKRAKERQKFQQKVKKKEQEHTLK